MTKPCLSRFAAFVAGGGEGEERIAKSQGAGQAGYRALVMRKMAKALGFCALASA
ncbi:MAG: hypothetical protein LW833_15320 [Hyphomicrobiales bacterium]|nr:hypothetical protein [Hyphomicrobiales bacterium]